MELVLTGVIISVLVMIARKLSGKYGKEPARNVLVLGVVVLSVIAALLYETLPEPFLMSVVEIVAAAVGFYEIIWKTVLSPVLAKIS